MAIDSAVPIAIQKITSMRSLARSFSNKNKNVNNDRLAIENVQ